jgi:hypothetical protein
MHVNTLLTLPSNRRCPSGSYRIIIGLGAAFLFTNSSAIVTDSFAGYGQVGTAQVGAMTAAV